MRVVDVFFAFPFLVLVLAIIAMLGPVVLNLFIAIWTVGWVSYARIIRGRRWWPGNRSMCWRPAPLATAIYGSSCGTPAQCDLRSGNLLHGRCGRQYYPWRGTRLPGPWRAATGAGMGPDGVGRPDLYGEEWWLPTIPGLAIVLVGVAFSLIGDGLTDLLRPQG